MAHRRLDVFFYGLFMYRPEPVLAVTRDGATVAAIRDGGAARTPIEALRRETHQHPLLDIWTFDFDRHRWGRLASERWEA